MRWQGHQQGHGRSSTCSARAGPGRRARPGATPLVDRGRAVSHLDVAVVGPAASERTSCARLRGPTGNYLRTGELGFRHDSGLHLAEPRGVPVTR